ncbi:glucosamine--fructose-6-phosphate aminotransferase (isomerizing) [Limimonas halophila]|uniref:Glutamine--fructose-6-phosphate aminotransferase [isomerizing] n=1 Tax=Limimonas halophila TaxID=1082479 RepID=A0A1G7S9F1_9PROT|nr:SIS domain-containing protein [Limimonas halophila]SDG19675.1 glucosamine--fructose-6-phosphate aminotransferase (isomerizing) [Limimonas halophila]
MPTFTYDEQIASQPAAVRDALGSIAAPALDPARPVVFTGIGTSLHACRIAARWTAALTDGAIRPHAVEAHELAGQAPLRADDQVVVVSHRGSKRFPNAVLQRARDVGARTVAVTGDGPHEPDADTVLRTCAGERAATHTVSYLTALAALGRLVAGLLGEAAARPLTAALAAVPEHLQQAVDAPAPVAAAEQLAARSPLVMAGFGLDAVTAGEAALKIKEGAYLWAEGMSVEAALHGPAAVYQEPAAMVTIAPAGDDGGRIGQLQQLGRDLGLPVVTCASEPEADLWFPEAPAMVQPMLSIVPLQRLVAELARLRGTNPDTIRTDEEPWASAMKRVRL